MTHTTTSCSMRSMSGITTVKINSSKNKKRLTLFINPEILKQAKAQAVIEESSLTSLVEKALILYLPSETIVKKTEN